MYETVWRASYVLSFHLRFWAKWTSATGCWSTEAILPTAPLNPYANQTGGATGRTEKTHIAQFILVIFVLAYKSPGVLCLVAFSVPLPAALVFSW